MRHMNWNKISKLVVTATCGVCLAKAFNRRKVFAGSTDDVTNLMSAREERKLTLRQVQVFFRHGARTPLHLTPNVEEASYISEFVLRDAQHTLFRFKLCNLDNTAIQTSPFEAHYSKTQLKGGGHAGILTSRGQDQMYMLGRRLKHDYINSGFFSSDFSPRDVFVRSTNINRTIQSARCVLAGLYGAKQLNLKGSVTVLTSVSEKEVLFPNAFNCPVMRKVNHASMVHFDDIPGLTEDRMKLEDVLGIDSKSGGKKINFIDVRDDLIGRITHGLLIPDKLVPYLEMIEENATRMLFFAMCGQHDAERKVVVRLSGGPALTMAIKEMQEVVAGKSKKKICLYSTHDSLMCCLLEGFGLYDDLWPPFAADLRIELYEDDEKQNWVKVLYCGKEQVIRGCENSLCSYAEFMSAIKPYMIETDEYKQICDSDILEKIAMEFLAHEADEVEDTESKERSDIPAGM